MTACSFIRLPGGASAVVCGRGPLRPCHYCGRPSSKLCDRPAGPGRTCDRRLCPGCAVHLGPDRDECRAHHDGER